MTGRFHHDLPLAFPLPAESLQLPTRPVNNMQRLERLLVNGVLLVRVQVQDSD